MKPSRAQPPLPPKNKHQAKTEATLRDLFDAAEKIFARDGYARTQIETIAAEAGRTKGAVYAHFKSKEDLFLALFERKVRGQIATVQSWPEDMPFEDRIRAGRKLFVSSWEEETWPILLLEFKLFALRNTRSVERIRDLYKHLYTGLPGRTRRSKAQQKREVIALAVMRGIPSAIALERHFDARLQSPDTIREALKTIFDALVPLVAVPPAEPTSLKPSTRGKRSR
jgi:AcrR family transcriptional regulator